MKVHRITCHRRESPRMNGRRVFLHRGRTHIFFALCFTLHFQRPDGRDQEEEARTSLHVPSAIESLSRRTEISVRCCQLFLIKFLEWKICIAAVLSLHHVNHV